MGDERSVGSQLSVGGEECEVSQHENNARVWNEAEDAQLYQCRTDGTAWADIAKSLGRTEKACKRRCERRWGRVDQVQRPQGQLQTGAPAPAAAASRPSAEGAGSCVPRADAEPAGRSALQTCSRKRRRERREATYSMEHRWETREALRKTVQLVEALAERQAEMQGEEEAAACHTPVPRCASEPLRAGSATVPAEAGAMPLHASCVAQSEGALLRGGPSKGSEVDETRLRLRSRWSGGSTPAGSARSTS